MNFGDRDVDIDTGRVARPDHADATLRPRELSLLRMLLRHAETPVPYGRLMSVVWGLPEDADRAVLYSTLRRLRRTVEERPSWPRYLKTVPGEGVVLTRWGQGPPGNLGTAPASAFYGRSAELADLVSDGHRWVHVSGPPGIGKTRLCREAAHRPELRMPGGCWWVDMHDAPLSEQLATAMGVAQGNLPNHLRRVGRTLCVLDGATDLEEVHRWLATLPGLRLWTCGTTCDPPSGAAHHLPLQGLADDAARALLATAGSLPEDADVALAAVGGVPAAIDHLTPLVATFGGKGALTALTDADDHGLHDLADAWAASLPDGLGDVLRQLVVWQRATVDRLAAGVQHPEPVTRWLPSLRARGMAQVDEGITAHPFLRAYLTPSPAASERHLAIQARYATDRMSAAGGEVPPVNDLDRAWLDDGLAAASRALERADPDHADLLELAIHTAMRVGRPVEARELHRRAMGVDLPSSAALRMESIDLRRTRHAGDRLRLESRWRGFGERAIAAGQPAIAIRIATFAATEAFNHTRFDAAQAAIDQASRWLHGAELAEPVRLLHIARIDQHHALLSFDDGVVEQAHRSGCSAADALDRPDLRGHAHFRLAQLRIHTWRTQEAEMLLEASLQGADAWSTGTVEVYLGCKLAEARARGGRLDAARQALEQAEASWQHFGATYRLELLDQAACLIALADGDRAEAQRAADRAVREARRAQRTDLTPRLLQLTARPDRLADDAPTLLMDALHTHAYDTAVTLVELVAARHLADPTNPGIDWMLERLEGHDLGSLMVDLCTVMAELPAHRDEARARILGVSSDRPRAHWLERWLAAEAGERVRPSFVAVDDPWVAVHQARIWRILGRDVQAELELRRVRPSLAEPLLGMAVEALRRPVERHP